jgi:hypothetical protein
VVFGCRGGGFTPPPLGVWSPLAFEKGLGWLFCSFPGLLPGGFSFHSQPLRLWRFCSSRSDPVEVMVLLASSSGAFVFFFLFFLFSLCFVLSSRRCFQAIGFVGFGRSWCVSSWRGVSGRALTVWFYLALDLCVLARISATCASLWWSRTSFGPVVSSRGHAFSPLFGAWPAHAGELLPWSGA